MSTGAKSAPRVYRANALSAWAPTLAHFVPREVDSKCKPLPLFLHLHFQSVPLELTNNSTTLIHRRTQPA
jgi:hypothetical protein